ncbi:hypothetical protein [Bacillus xiapuensis]|uniref:Uncharacterized protein n=1 Tax=Bacillus xiapuensis TaxID=2014075 RepID=A0ABU6N7M6_9BACI|nr:hypothetical protein [Bacillus xiapuensis]
MPKRLTFDEVKKYVSDEGYELISDFYKNTSAKLLMKCPKAHVCQISFHKFKDRGNRCTECSGYKKYTLEEVKDIFEKDGYTLLSTDYKKNTLPLKVRCSNGHESMRTLNNHLKGVDCRFCNTHGIKKTIDEISKYAEKYNFKLLSDEYLNKDSKLTFQCPKGHEFEMRWNNFRHGQRCPFCKNSKGENVVRYVLDNILPDEVKFEEQKRFYFGSKECFIYDFYIDLHFTKVFIEFDGMQHFTFKSYFHKDIETFERKVKRDFDKDKFANKNGQMIRVNYSMTNDEIADCLILELSKFIVLKCQKVNTSEAEFYLRNSYSIQEMTKYYLIHTLEETTKKYSISSGTVFREFKNIYGVSRTKYLKESKIN